MIPGDMNKPIYRHLADLKWRSHKRQILMQRITQMNVVPDVLPAVDPTVSTELSFGSKRIEHGDFVLSSLSTKTPSLDIQSYDKGSKLVSIAVVTPDVPNVEKDGFDYRCHFLASNIHISPTRTSVDLSKLSRKNQVIQSWLPPTSQKGAPYQRLSIFILEQPVTEAASSTPGKLTTLDVEAIKKDERYTKRENFILRSFVNRHNLQPIGVDLFRTQYDEDMESVMRKRGMAGWDVEFKRKRINPLPYQRLKSERYR